MLAFAGTERFQIIRHLGSGGMGVVFEVYDREQACRSALKLLPRCTPEALLRFKHEFRALQGLHHPNLVSLGELLEEGGHWFFTMELVSGVDIMSYLRADEGYLPETVVSMTGAGPTVGLGALPGPPTRLAGGVDEGRVRDCLAQLTRGLACLHEAGKVHRDVKPSNILVTPEGRVVLLDFGLITELGAPRGSKVVGTPAFMAPEQAAGGEVGPPADFYALGQVLYCVLTGQVSWDTPSGATRPSEITPRQRRFSWLESGLPRGVSRPSQLVPGVSPLLDDLCVELLSADPARRPNAAEILRWLGQEAAPARPGRADFFGRTDELARLREAGQASRKGPIVVGLEGPSGIGKTALVDEFVAWARASGDDPLVLRGRCYEHEGIPFKAVDGVMDALGAHLLERPRVPTGAPRLARLFPALSRVPGFAGEVGGDAHEIRRGAERAARELLAGLAERRPVFVVIDDFQWTDDDSVAFLAGLLGGDDAPRVLVVLASRERVALPGAVHIEVGPLPDADARALATHALASAARDGAGAATIVAEAAGHPFFIAELAHHGGGPVARLDDLLARRIAACPPAARRLLELVALASTPLPQALCGEAAGLDRAATARAVAKLRAERLVRTGGVRPGDPVETYHDRIRETLVARLGPRTQACHAALADVLERRRPDDFEALVAHCEGAGDLPRAGRYAVAAGEQARAALAFERAASFFRQALAWSPSPFAREQQLRIRLAQALADAGRGGEAANEYARAADEAPPEASLDLLRLAGEQRLRSGLLDEGLTTITAVLRRVGVRLPRGRLPTLASLLASRARVRLRGLGFRARSASADELRRIDALWSASSTLGSIDTLLGADVQARHLLLALDAGEPFRAQRALLAEASYVALSGPRARSQALALLARAERLAEPTPYIDALAEFARGVIAYESGDYALGYAWLTRADKRWVTNCTGVSHEIAMAQRFALDNRFYQGELGELRARIPALLADAERRGDRYLAAELGTGLPNVIWLCADDLTGARVATRRGIEGWSQRGFHLQHYYDALARAHIALYENRGGEAHAIIEALWPGLRASLLLGVQAVKVEAWGLRARAAVAAGVPRVAERAVAVLERDLVPAAAGFALAARAGMGRSIERLREAEAIFARHGVGMYAAGCRYHLPGGRDEATAWMRAHGVDRPEAFVRLLAPGFD